MKIEWTHAHWLNGDKTKIYAIRRIRRSDGRYISQRLILNHKDPRGYPAAEFREVVRKLGTKTIDENTATTTLPDEKRSTLFTSEDGL